MELCIKPVMRKEKITKKAPENNFTDLNEH